MSRFEAAEWKLLTDLIQDRFGLTFDGIRCEILESRLQPRLRELHLQSLRDYYQFLRFHPEREAEFVRLTPLITNNETYFFREAHHFDLLVRQIVPELRPALRSRPLRLLSAACSSGEEAYSMVIALQNAGLELAGVRWEIDACDLNPERIAQAREASYDAGSLRACDDETRRRYFREVGGKYELRERYRKGVRFFEANLLAPNGVFGWGDLRRHLLPQHADLLRRGSIRRRHQSLRPFPGAGRLPPPRAFGVPARPGERLPAGVLR